MNHLWVQNVLHMGLGEKYAKDWVRTHGTPFDLTNRDRDLADAPDEVLADARRPRPPDARRPRSEKGNERTSNRISNRMTPYGGTRKRVKRTKKGRIPKKRLFL